MSEFDLIERLQRTLGAIAVDRLVLGIGDDAALWSPRIGHHVVACCDTLIAGRHFPIDTDAADIGWKALAVNLSDLAAMGAEPVAALLALSLPDRPEPIWLDGFCRGWAELAGMHGVALAGGDTTRGPVLALAVTCFGELPEGDALRRAGARVDDDIYVSGTVGDAAAGLAFWSDRDLPAQALLCRRLTRPQPRLALGRALRSLASAAIDVSDGLAADLRHVLAASQAGAELDLEQLPLSSALRAAVPASQARHYALSGGDDYELCFTAASTRRDDIRAVADATATVVTRIGRVVAEPGLRARAPDGALRELPVSGWDPFRDDR